MEGIRMTLLIVDRHIFSMLPQSKKDRIAVGLADLGHSLDDTAEAYTDDDGKVVGALFYVLDDEGHKTGQQGLIGETP